MVATTDTPRVSAWLYSRLSPILGTSQTFYRVAERGTTGRRIVYSPASSADIVTLYDTYMIRSLWDVIVWEQDVTEQDLLPTMDSVRSAIHKPSITLTNGRYIEECRQVGEIPTLSNYYPNPDGDWWAALGATFRVYSSLA